jgi:hypothetical protein|tara:strand:+ start:40 stop:213 length:174 start_codon:yes stop_codon:yes gene_type:complete
MDRPIFKDMSDLNEEQKLFFKIEQIYSHLHGAPHHMELHERLMKLSIMNLDDENSYS